MRVIAYLCFLLCGFPQTVNSGKEIGCPPTTFLQIQQSNYHHHRHHHLSYPAVLLGLSLSTLVDPACFFCTHSLQPSPFATLDWKIYWIHPTSIYFTFCPTCLQSSSFPTTTLLILHLAENTYSRLPIKRNATYGNRSKIRSTVAAIYKQPLKPAADNPKFYNAVEDCALL